MPHQAAATAVHELMGKARLRSTSLPRGNLYADPRIAQEDVAKLEQTALMRGSSKNPCSQPTKARSMSSESVKTAGTPNGVASSDCRHNRGQGNAMPRSSTG